MAITILQTPDLISPTYSPMFFMNSSDYSTETGFKYVYDLYDVAGLVASKKVLPFPNDYGRIDVSNILKNYLSSDLQFNSTGITSSTESIRQYELKVGHTGSTHTLAVASTGIRYTFNGVDNDDFSYTNYMLSGTSAKLLTPLTTIPVYKSDYYTLGFFNGVFSGLTTSIKYIYIRIYGTNTGTYRLENPDYEFNPGASLANVDKMIKIVGVGPMNINASTLYNTGTSANETGTFIHSGTTYYEVWATNSSTTAMSSTYTFTLKQNDGRYSQNQLAFLNRLGQYSYLTLVGKTTETTKQNVGTFLKNRYYLNGTLWDTDSSRRGTSVYSSSVSTEYTFVSDYLSQSEYDLAEQLFTSPDVYWLKLGEAIPLVILDTDWSNRKIVNDKVINFTIKCGLANNKKTNI